MNASQRRILVFSICVALAGPQGCSSSSSGSDGGGTGSDTPDATFDLTLGWDRPTENADGSLLEDLGGFRIYYDTTSPVIPEESLFVDVGDVTTHTVSDLAPGVYHFSVAAIDVNGNMSELSGEVSAEVGQ